MSKSSLQRFQLQQGGLFLVFLLIIAVLAAALALLSPDQPETEPLANRSVYNYGATGYRAWYLASKKAGIPILTWERSFAHLDEMPSPATMLMVEPYTVAKTSIIFGKKEGLYLLKWVEEGNTLVLLDSFKRYGSDFMADILSLDIHTRKKPQHSASGFSPSQSVQIEPTQNILSSYVRQGLLSETALSFKLGNEAKSLFNEALQHQVLLENAYHQPLMIRIPYGKGIIILGTTADLGANRFLQGPTNDNYQFLSNLLVREKKPIFINEFIHGYTEAGDLLSYYQKHTPLGPIFAQFVLAFIVLLWLSFIRWTPKPQEALELPTTEAGTGLDAYIQSLAGIYHRTQSSSLALEPLLRRIESTLRQKFGVSLDEEARLQNLLLNVFADYSNKGASPDSALETLKKAQAATRRQEKLSERDLLRLVQQLTGIEERLQHYGQRTHTIRS
jgi:hypothetical protein